MGSSGGRKLKIAFISAESNKWIAGLHYHKNLFKALHSLGVEETPQILLVKPQCHSSQLPDDLRELVNQELIWPVKFGTIRNQWTSYASLVRKVSGIWIGPQRSMGSMLSKNDVNCVFSTTHYGPRFNVPLLTWIYDFQHVHLPDMFPANEVLGRNSSFRRRINNADRVILSSKTALDDLESFAPKSVHKARILRFVADVSPDIYQEDPAQISQIYDLPSRFFYLPNQFWKHKNHKIVLAAMKRLKSKNFTINVVCSGGTYENRDPTYFPYLLSEISNSGLRNHFIILGMIPHKHVLQLIRQSIAVLQPSLFEGWSTTVEETKSIGKRIIMSDIPVHREQNPAGGIYFDPHNANNLAEILLDANFKNHPGPDFILEDKARKELNFRQKQYGQTFLGILHDVVSDN